MEIVVNYLNREILHEKQALVEKQLCIVFEPQRNVMQVHSAIVHAITLKEIYTNCEQILLVKGQQSYATLIRLISMRSIGTFDDVIFQTVASNQ